MAARVMARDLRPAMVVVEAVNVGSVVSRTVAAVTDSEWTHSWMYVGNGVGVEAWFPRVRLFDAQKRLASHYERRRPFVVLDHPDPWIDQVRNRVAARAVSYTGRWYDVGQAFLYAALGGFWGDGSGTLICSRLVTASYLAVMGRHSGNLFPERVLLEKYGTQHPRARQLAHGWATPGDLLASRLQTLVRWCP